MPLFLGLRRSRVGELGNECLEHLEISLRGGDIVACPRQFVEDVVQFIHIYWIAKVQCCMSISLFSVKDRRRKNERVSNEVFR